MKCPKIDISKLANSKCDDRLNNLNTITKIKVYENGDVFDELGNYMGKLGENVIIHKAVDFNNEGKTNI